MKGVKVKVVQRKAKAHILHEFNSKGQHRLVLVGEEGNRASGWMEGHQIGYFEGLFFSGWNSGQPLKAGVWRTSGVPHRTLPEHPHESFTNDMAGSPVELAKKDVTKRNRA